MQSYYLKLLNMCKFAYDRKTLLINIMFIVLQKLPSKP